MSISGGIDALGIEEPFEKQAVTNRIDVGNFQQIGHQGTGCRAARDARNALASAITHKVADDEKVADEAGFLDDFQFDLKSVHDAFKLRIGRATAVRQFLRIVNAVNNK